LKQSLKKWAEGDFKSDPQLNLIPTLYNKMKQEGHDFTDNSIPAKREIEKSTDPNVVSSQQEEDDIAKAIELSLKERTPSKAVTISSTTNTSSLYPSVSGLTSSTASNATASKAPESRKVRALYDFEAAEDNELTFKAGEIIMVFEETDPNWWRGSNHRGEGYFPANFVTADLSAEPEDLTQKDTQKSIKENATNISSTNEERRNEQPVEINEEAIDRLLFLLHEADPEDPSQDTDEMMRLENFVNQMGPLIDSELERVDRRHAQLTQLSSDLIDTINLYHSLMRDTEKINMGMMNQFPNMQNQMYRPNNSFPTHHMNQMGMNDQMHPNFPQHMHSSVQPGSMPSMSQINNQIPSMPQEQMIQQYPQIPQHAVNGVQPMPQMPSAIYQNNTQDMSQANMLPQHSLPGTFPQNHNLGIAQNILLSLSMNVSSNSFTKSYQFFLRFSSKLHIISSSTAATTESNDRAKFPNESKSNGTHESSTTSTNYGNARKYDTSVIKYAHHDANGLSSAAIRFSTATIISTAMNKYIFFVLRT
jgi:signal transducing adaptor molecule